jgi:TRAP-type C4-dicarboxylate transport system permease small subunit
LYNFVRDALAVISGILVAAMVVYVSLSVILRFTPFVLSWSLEAAEYSLIMLTLFSAGWLLKNRGHTRIDLFLDMIKNRRARSIVEGVLYIVTTAICLFLLILSGIVTWETYAAGTLQVKVYTFPKWMLCAIIPIGFFFLFIESVKLICEYFKNQKNVK